MDSIANGDESSMSGLVSRFLRLFVGDGLLAEKSLMVEKFLYSQSEFHLSLVSVKIFCLVIMMVLTFLAGISPYFFRWSDAFLVLGLQFAGGVFLTTAMLHFLSDSNESFRLLTDTKYPLAFLLFVLGYLITMFGDLTAQGIKSRLKTQPEPIEEKDHSSMNHISGDDCQVKPKSKSKDVESAENVNFDKNSGANKLPVGDVVMLVIALCFHSVFEGVTIGIADTPGEAWRNLWTISLHKFFAAVSASIALLRTVPNRPLLQCIRLSFSLSAASPLGIAIGIVISVTTTGTATEWINGVALGVASGIFVYVAINHIFAKSYTAAGSNLAIDTPHYKFLATLAGVLLLALVMMTE